MGHDVLHVFGHYCRRVVSGVTGDSPKDVKGSSLTFFFKQVTSLALFSVPGWVIGMGRRWLFVGVGAAERLVMRLFKIGT